MLQGRTDTARRHMYCEMGRRCLYNRARLHKWEKQPTTKRPWPCARQFRLATTVQKYPQCFLECGHFCCTDIPTEVPWEEGEEIQTCAQKHASQCISTAGSRLEFFKNQVEADRQKPVRSHHIQERDKAVTASTLYSKHCIPSSMTLQHD